MRKISLLVLCFIVFSLLLTLPAVCYAKTSTILASTWNKGLPLPSLDLEANIRITQYIYDCSVASGYTSYNWFGSEATQDHIFDAAAGVGDIYSISFFIGHGTDGTVLNGIVPEWQYWIYDSDGNRVYDREIYPYSACRNVRFVFLWACEQGDTIGGTHWSQTHYGMPYAWVHTTDLSTDGYASPDNNGYCFIGFDGDTTSILREFDGRYAVGYYFIGYFYAAALCGDKTINEALDYASQKIWRVNFGESMLYNGFEWVTDSGETCSGKMVVYGDGNLNVGNSVTAPTLPTPPLVGGGAGGGGPCPTLFVWNGSDYIDLGVIDIHAAEDVVREVSVAPGSVGVNNCKAEFRLREGWEGLTYSHSEIDQVKLYTVDSDGNRHLCPLVEATHSELGNVLPQLLLSDDTRIDLYLLETIDLKFVVPGQTDQTQDFVFVIEGCNMYKY